MEFYNKLRRYYTNLAVSYINMQVSYKNVQLSGIFVSICWFIKSVRYKKSPIYLTCKRFQRSQTHIIMKCKRLHHTFKKKAYYLVDFLDLACLLASISAKRSISF